MKIKNAKLFQLFKNCMHVANCKIKNKKVVWSHRWRFFPLFFANSSTRIISPLLCVFSPQFFFFPEGERRKGWVSGRTSPPHPHPTLQSGFYGHSIFCRAVSSFSDELMCSVNPVRWLPPYSGGYANTSKPEHFRPIHGPRQHTFH